MPERARRALLWWLATTFACVGGLVYNLTSGTHVAPGPGLTLVSEGATYALMDIPGLTIAFGALPVAAFLGLAQWLVIRRQLSFAGFWVLGTTIGWVIGIFRGPVIGGLLLGALQYLAVATRLRRPLVGLLWPLASALAWIAGATVQGFLPTTNTVLEADLTPLAGWSAGWAVFGVVSAVAFAVVFSDDQSPVSVRRGAPPPPDRRGVQPGVTARSVPPYRPSRLHGLRLFAAWLLIGIGTLLVAALTSGSGLAWVTFATAGLAQGWLLRNALGLPILLEWAAATCFGGLLGAAFGTFSARGIVPVPGTTAELGATVLASLVFGAILGLAQWTVLRRLRGAWLWIPTMALAILASSVLAVYLEGLRPWAGGLLAPAISGASLVWLQGSQSHALDPVSGARSAFRP